MIGDHKYHCVLTLVECKAGRANAKKQASRMVAEVNEAALVAISEHRKQFTKITLDNGTEFHLNHASEQVHSVKCYFVSPSHHPWEKGCNEIIQRTASSVLLKGAVHEQSHAG